MRRTLCLAALALACAAAAPPPPAPSVGGNPLVGKNLPGTFHAFNVTARIVAAAEPDPKGKGEKTPSPSTRGKFHCLITEYDLDPVVMLILRGGAEEKPGARALLKQLDATLDKNQAARLRAFAVVLLDDLVDDKGKKVEADVSTFDRQRVDTATRLEKLADDLKLKGLVLAIAAPRDLAAFRLDESQSLNAILYTRLKVQAVHDLSADELEKENGAAARAILGDVKAKLKAGG